MPGAAVPARQCDRQYPRLLRLASSMSMAAGRSAAKTVSRFRRSLLLGSSHSFPSPSQFGELKRTASPMQTLTSLYTLSGARYVHIMHTLCTTLCTDYALLSSRSLDRARTHRPATTGPESTSRSALLLRRHCQPKCCHTLRQWPWWQRPGILYAKSRGIRRHVGSAGSEHASGAQRRERRRNL